MPAQVAPLAAAGTLARVDNAGALRLGQAIPGQLQAQADVHVFAVHVVGLVEALDALVGRAVEQQQCSVGPVGRRNPCPAPGAAAQVALQQSTRGGQAAGMVLGLAVGIDLLRIHAAHAGLLRGLQHGGPGILGPGDVGVHDHKEGRRRALLLLMSKGLVVVGSKAQWLGVVQHAHIQATAPGSIRGGQRLREGGLGGVERDPDAANQRLR